MKKWRNGWAGALVVVAVLATPGLATPVYANEVQVDTMTLRDDDDVQATESADAQDTAADQTDPAAASSDPEWKYVPVRRTASTGSNGAYFDGRLLTADDLARD